MDQSKILKAMEFAKYYAASKGYGKDAEDFSQEVFIAYAEGRKATIEQLFIDYLRKFYGDTRSAGGLAKSFERHVSRSIDESEAIYKLCESQSDRIDHSPSEHSGPDRRIRACLNRQQLLVYDLLVFEELNVKEIGELLGLTGGRISQIIATIKPIFKNCKIIDEHLDYYLADKEASKLIVDWITI